MTAGLNHTEETAAAAFNRQSLVFDEIYSANKIVRYKRERVRNHISNYLHPGDTILELNCGTGDDALWFAKQGHEIHATDISAGMLQVLQQKMQKSNLQQKISYEQCSFTALEQLKKRGPYNYIFSNFAGLNCTDKLDKVLQALPSLLLPGGVVTLVILPKVCLWEILLVFKGKFKTAFRRFFSAKGRTAHIEGEYFKCWYYNPAYVVRNTAGEFTVLSIEGLCSIVPPSYIENFPDKYPSFFSHLKKKEDKWKNKWPFRSTGDYYIISLCKKGASAD